MNLTYKYCQQNFRENHRPLVKMNMSASPCTEHSWLPNKNSLKEEVYVWPLPPFSHCVSCTVISGCVLSFQGIHLQVHQAVGIVPGDGESAFHSICIVGATSISINTWDPLQPLPRSLANPEHPIAAECESRSFAGEFQGSSRLSHVSPRLHQLNITMDTCKKKSHYKP